ncbi:MAG: RNA polymerase sigma factor [Gemmatimonadetes bacterium]|nr:RNA polymerase sigma factor [Gemmatimonadota bacterium]
MSAMPAFHPEPRVHDAESDTIRRAQSGDEAAFTALYHAHAGRVFALCLRMAGDRARATDLAQDVFVRLWERLPQFRFESALTTWLHRLAVTTVLEAMRAELRRSARVTAADDEVLDAAAGADVPLDVRLALDRAIPRLPSGQRQVFVLHVIEGLPTDEIAALTGLATATVRVHLHRARRHLLAELSA